MTEPAQNSPLCRGLGPAPAAALVARGLRKQLGSTDAVAGVSLSVGVGEVVGLLGPNGAGKTTLLHLLAGVLAPDAGEILVAGAADPTRASVRARIGFAPQSTAVYEALSAEENLIFFAQLHGLHGRKLTEQVDRALVFAGLVDRRHQRAATFSGGMKRRLHVAAALVHAPAVLLLDEPTVGVDAASRGQLLDGVAELRARGCGVLYASHHLDEVSRVCDRAIVLSRGKVVADDRVDRLAASMDLEATLRARSEP